jgi:hypothetical protein
MIPRHLVIRNPDLPGGTDPRGRIGCWNTVMLTACKRLLAPEDERVVTLRLDLVTCAACLAWTKKNRESLEDDGAGHLVTSR